MWAGVVLFTFLCLLIADNVSWVAAWPVELVLPLVDLLNGLMAWFIEWFGWFFRGLGWLLGWPIAATQWVLHGLPWPITIGLITIVAHKAGGWRLALFAAASMFYMLIVGYWDESMNTLALVAISVPLSIAVGFGFGVLAFRSPKARRIVMPSLDLLQTVPVFAYLIPILLLFGFGTVVGLVASLLYAFPPMVRNTVLGLERVPSEAIESGLMAGASERQLFWQVRVPSASRQILLGVNQTTMAALSMVIIASIIGGTADIGWEVLSTIRKATFGESLLAGVVIALIAMVMDRVSRGFALREVDLHAAERPFIQRHAHMIAVGFLVAAVAALVQIAPFLVDYPRDWTFFPAKPMNDAILYVVVEYKDLINYIKQISFFFVMLPLRIGLENTVRPSTWGIDPGAVHAIGYALLVCLLAFLAARAWSVKAAMAVLLAGMVYYFGLTNIPWPALFVIFGGLAWSTGGSRLAVGVLIGLSYLLLTGIWELAVLSVYLCGIAVIASFAVGSAIGIWAAHDDRVSAFIRPINDTLQTMPQFVPLIPILMIFKIGDFTALLAIMAYAIVPAVRYSEHALRSLPAEIVEAATAMGCNRRQLLWQVKIPMALPEMMLGLNQTIMYGISMLVIAALVGTKDLGQQVYVGLGDGDFGVGMVAGVGMAVIAIVADRITQAWSAKKRAELGMA
ncbi:MAG: ABC transporter permease subunit [Alphaproteobacteria bacterium]|nr:ABC transporter permease subunit [Alphaproteobacteria bacterium]